MPSVTKSSSRSLASAYRKVSVGGKGLYKVQQRFIALYRPTFKPWARYELKHIPEFAKSCEEQVLRAFAEGNAEELKVVFHKYRSLGSLPTNETWHKFLLTCYQEGQYLELESLIAELNMFGVPVDVHAWNFLLDVVTKQRLMTKSMNVFWSMMRYLKSHVNEFSFRTYFNMLMEEKKYNRAMVVYAGMLDYGYGISEEEHKTLEKFCLEYLLKQPGGWDILRVPDAEDGRKLKKAAERDELIGARDAYHVLSCVDDLTPKGKELVLEWYTRRIPANTTPQEAFKHVLHNCRIQWDQYMAGALRIEPLRLSILRPLMWSPKDMEKEYFFYLSLRYNPIVSLANRKLSIIKMPVDEQNLQLFAFMEGRQLIYEIRNDTGEKMEAEATIQAFHNKLREHSFESLVQYL